MKKVGAENPVFSDEIEILETTDTNHADNFNVGTLVLFKNTLANRKEIEEVKENAYTHPTTPGSKHIPSGGSRGQILRWSADGTAAWGTDNNTTYGMATATADGLMSAADKAKLDGMAEVATSGNYNDLSGKPTIPTVGNGTVTIKQAGEQKGTFAMNQSGDTTIELADSNTTYGNMGAATATAAGKAGLVPAPPKGAQDKFLRGDGTFQTPPNTVYTHPNSGVAAGTYRSLTVDAQGHVTGGSNPVLTVAQGGTGATTAAQALANIGAAAASHTHNYATASHTHNYAGSASAGGAANRALGDSDGAQINATYRKKAEGSVVRIQASAPADTTALWVS